MGVCALAAPLSVIWGLGFVRDQLQGREGGGGGGAGQEGVEPTEACTHAHVASHIMTCVACYVCGEQVKQLGLKQLHSRVAGGMVETVLIPVVRESGQRNRITLCVSSQVCAPLCVQVQAWACWCANIVWWCVSIC